MPTTSNFGWTTPADTDLVKDGAAAIRTLGNGIDTSFIDLKGGTTGQVLSKASNTDLDFSWVAQDDSNAIQNAIVDAKGDLITATGADVPARLAVGTNGYTLVAASGESTGLKWQLAPAFHGVSVYNSAAQTISNATFTTVTFDSEWFDTDAFHSTSTNTSRLTVPAGFDGYYRVEAKLFFASNGTGSRIGNFRKNGADVDAGYLEQGAYSNGKNFMHFFVVLNLAAGDYMEVQIYQNSGGNLATDASAYSAFNMHYLGAA